MKENFMLNLNLNHNAGHELDTRYLKRGDAENKNTLLPLAALRNAWKLQFPNSHGPSSLGLNSSSSLGSNSLNFSMLVANPSIVMVLMRTVSPTKVSCSATDMKASLIISMARSSLISHGVSNCKLVKPIRLSNIGWMVSQAEPATLK
uniref:Uncharacterized protein n=1 Tax=Glossina austeni TaxID=7395 RepID=A0A1A9UHB9_GLOAU